MNTTKTLNHKALPVSPEGEHPLFSDIRIAGRVNNLGV